MFLADAHKLYHWFAVNKRNFPWRKDKTPYAVWVAEVMLQQTRAAVVVEYFIRWMKRFPTVESLANAPIEEVIKLWEGLGYYQRARNLHQGAKQVVDLYGGMVPQDKEKLFQIQGLGPYTVSAILAFAFGEKKVPIDGNIKRVFSRYFLLEEPLGTAASTKALEEKAKWIETVFTHQIGEAFIELGAVICGKNPACFSCPMQRGCRAFHEGKQQDLPKKKPRKKPTVLERIVLILDYRDQVLVRKNTEALMRDLFEFPYFPWEGESTMNRLAAAYSLTISPNQPLRRYPKACHTFTRFKANLHPFHLVLDEKPHIPGYGWKKKTELKDLPFSSGHRQILEHL